MSLSPDEKTVLVTNASSGLTIYDIYSARVIACARDIRGLDKGSPAMFVHGGHAVLVGCKGGEAKLFDTTSTSCLQTLNHEGKCAVSPNDISNLTLGGGDICALTVRMSNPEVPPSVFSLPGAHSQQRRPVYSRNLCCKGRTVRNIRLGDRRTRYGSLSSQQFVYSTSGCQHRFRPRA